MRNVRYSVIDSTLWLLVVYLTLHVPGLHSRVDELEQAALKYAHQQPPASTQKPEPPKQDLKPLQCFRMDRSQCPTSGQLKCLLTADNVSVFCCDVDGFRLKEGLAGVITQNVTNLHVLNASIDELDISQATYRRLVSMSVTDGHIGKIIGQFPKHSSMACLNISNNNLTSAKLQPSSPGAAPPSIARPFAYLFNLSTLDASGNNLTEFPLSLVHSNRKIFVDLSGNNYLPCKHFQRAMDSNISSLEFLNYNRTYCAHDFAFAWFNNVRIVQIDRLREQRELNAICRDIRPANISCQCSPLRWEFMDGDVSGMVAVDCSARHLTEMPTHLPPNTVKLNVSYNNITSLKAVELDPSYEHLRQLSVDHNDVTSIVELEGTKFIDNFMLFSMTHNKLKTIHTYVLSNQFDSTATAYTTLMIGGNHIHCDCNTEKVLKAWLVENFKYIPDYKNLMCENGMGPVYELEESKVCHMPRDWTDYIYFIIGLEVFTLVLLISKVSYDYWVFKTAGYLPWPANKMPRLPCDWLCE